MKLFVTQEQEETIKAFLDFNDWHDILCSVDDSTSVEEAGLCVVTSPVNDSCMSDPCISQRDYQPGDSDNADHQQVADFEILANQCPYCFLEPCATSNPQG